MKNAVPALLFGQDDGALGSDGTWLSALYRFALAKASVPGLRAGIQRADRHGAEPASAANGCRFPRGLLAAALQAEPAGSGRDVPDPGPRVHSRGGARLGGQAGPTAGRGP